MLLKNKEGNCFRSTEDPKKIESLKALGYVEVTPEVTEKADGKSKDEKKQGGKSKGKSDAPEVTEKADGSVTVDM